MEKLTAAILDQVELYCSTFNANFHPSPQSHSCTAPVQEAGLVTNILSFSVYAAHRVPITWATRYVRHASCVVFLQSCSGLTGYNVREGSTVPQIFFDSSHFLSED